MNNQAFSKIWIVVILLAFIAGGILVWQYLGVPKEEAGVPEEIAEDETANWKTYKNEEFEFEIRYPDSLVLVESSRKEFAKTGEIVSLVTPDIQQLVEENKTPSYSRNLVISYWPDINNIYAKGGSWIGEREYANLEDYFTDENASKKKVGESILDGKKAYEVSVVGYGLKYAIMIEHDGIYELSFERAWDKTEVGSIENQILSTFKFIGISAEGLPEEVRSNKDFIEWVEDWQAVKPSYAADTFTKVSENGFSLNGKPINQEELEDAMEKIQSPYLPEERRKLYYSPDRTKFIFNAGYPDPLEIDQDIVLFNLSTEKYQFLQTCGTACWFEKVFWINNNQFVVIRTGEYSFTEEYEHSIFLYDLEKNIVMEYKSSEKISTEELKKK